jgi:chromosome segregation ATPase
MGDLRRLTTRQRSENVGDPRTHSSEGNSLLYRYGQEMNSNGFPPAVVPPLGLGGSVDYSSLPDTTKFNDEDSVLSQITSLSKIRPKTLKVVSGSQFRLTTKGFSSCDQCELLDKANKKNKELIRSLKLQLLRMEESFKDLKYSRSLDLQLSEAQQSTDNHPKNSDGGAPSKKVERLEEEVLKLKKLLAFERNTNEALRQSLEEQQTRHENEASQLKLEIDKNSKVNAALAVNIHDLEHKLNDANAEISFLKQQMEQHHKHTLR